MFTYIGAQTELEETADTIKVSILSHLVNDKLIEKAKADDWCKSHTIIFRKKSFFRTITNTWEKRKESSGGEYILIVTKEHGDD